MLNVEDIISREVETNEDIISGDFCNCGHSISEEHLVGSITGTTKCYALRYNGTVISSCNCDKIVPIIYSINFTVPHAENSPIQT